MAPPDARDPGFTLPAPPEAVERPGRRRAREGRPDRQLLADLAGRRLRAATVGGVPVMIVAAVLEVGRSVLEAEAKAIAGLSLSESFADAVVTLARCRGKVVTTGMGKAGLVARKVAATFSATGTPSVFLHPGEAAHGDLGVLGQADVVLAFSNSGRTTEVLEVLELATAFKALDTISIGAETDTPIGRAAGVA